MTGAAVEVFSGRVMADIMVRHDVHGPRIIRLPRCPAGAARGGWVRRRPLWAGRGPRAWTVIWLASQAAGQRRGADTYAARAEHGQHTHQKHTSTTRTADSKHRTENRTSTAPSPRHVAPAHGRYEARGGRANEEDP
ncbi:hypothetical protein GCM10023324_01740 [Streptomyces youssoufiensis]